MAPFDSLEMVIACRWFDSVPGHQFQLLDSQRVPGITHALSGAIDGRPADYREVGGLGEVRGDGAGNWRAGSRESGGPHYVDLHDFHPEIPGDSARTAHVLPRTPRASNDSNSGRNRHRRDNTGACGRTGDSSSGGQLDLAGMPVLLHPMSMMLKVGTPQRGSPEDDTGIPGADNLSSVRVCIAKNFRQVPPKNDAQRMRIQRKAVDRGHVREGAHLDYPVRRMAPVHPPATLAEAPELVRATELRAVAGELLHGHGIQPTYLRYTLVLLVVRKLRVIRQRGERRLFAVQVGELHPDARGRSVRLRSEPAETAGTGETEPVSWIAQVGVVVRDPDLDLAAVLLVVARGALQDALSLRAVLPLDTGRGRGGAGQNATGREIDWQKYLARESQHLTYPDWQPRGIGLGSPLRTG